MKKTYSMFVLPAVLMFMPIFLFAAASIQMPEARKELLTQAVYAEQFKDEGFYSSKSKEDLRKALQAITQALKKDEEVLQLSGALSLSSTEIRELLSSAASKTTSQVEQRVAQEWAPASRRTRRKPRAKTGSRQRKPSGAKVYTPLMKAAQYNNVERVKRLLKGSVDVNVQNDRDETALFIATRFNHNDIANILLQAEADTDIAQKNGLTPLHQAVMNGNIELAQALIDAGANVNARDKFHNRTPLMWVGRVTVGAPKKQLKQISINKAKELIDLLLTHGADPRITDDKGLTALQWAKQINVQPLIEMLQ
ncbi:MAG: ankyrin repeat domain-containing protein [Candidatus Dependentiae bacterium]